MRRKKFTNVFFLIALVACLNGGCDDEGYDLPDGWEGATKVSIFSSSGCSESEDDGASHFDVSYNENEIYVEVFNIGFRCSQPIEAFQIENESAINVLIQPVDMNPDTVAFCDCNYNVTFTIDNSTGIDAPEINVYRRSDNIGGAGNPTEIEQE